MKHQIMSVLFYLNKAKTNQKGVCPIYCRITYLKKRREFSTGQFVNPTAWNPKKQLVELHDQNAIIINAELSIISQKLKTVHLKLQLKGSNFNVADIMNIYSGRMVKKEENVYSYYCSFLTGVKGLIGKDIKQSTYNKFNYVGNDVKAVMLNFG